MLLEIEKTLVEGAGAVGLAAMLRHRNAFGARRWGWCCGGNIDPLLLAAIIERGMVGRAAARIRVSARDVPGALARITAALAEVGANIEEAPPACLYHMLAAQNVEIELVLRHAAMPTWRKC